jgi:hypothetical protein
LDQRDRADLLITPSKIMPLTDVKIRQAKATDSALKLADTAGLYLEVKPNGSKLWRYRYRIAGRENLYAIGDYPSVSLADARKARDDARDLIKLGRHPAHARQTERTQQINANALTFKAIAEEWIAKKRSRWAPYYLLQIQRGMKKDIYPRIGRLPIRSVTAADVLAILDRATKRGAEVVALNLRQWCSQVFRYAVATLRAAIRSDPPLLWRRCDAAAIALLLAFSITALATSAGATLLVGVSLALLYAPLVVTARLLWRCRTRGQVDRAMAIAKCRARGRPQLRRVK